MLSDGWDTGAQGDRGSTIATRQARGSDRRVLGGRGNASAQWDGGSRWTSAIARQASGLRARWDSSSGNWEKAGGLGSDGGTGRGLEAGGAAQLRDSAGRGIGVLASSQVVVTAMEMGVGGGGQRGEEESGKLGELHDGWWT